MTTRALRPARVLAVLALTAPVAGIVVGASTSPALAASTASTVTLNPDTTVVTSAVDMAVTGAIKYTRGGVLSGDPSTGGGGSFVVNGPDGYTTNHQLPTCSASNNASCTSSATITVSASDLTSRRNGAWPVVMKGATVTTFYTNFAPTGVPANLAAAPNGNTEVDLSWSYSGTEPDKAGFEMAETHAGSSRTIRVGTGACNGSTCGYAITGYPVPAQGATDSYSYTVTALRTSGGCSTCGDVTRSAASSSADAQLVGPPAPTPTPSPTGTTGGTTGGQTGGSTGTASGGSTGTSSGGSTGGTTGTHSGGSTGTTSGGSTGTAAKPIVVPTLPPLLASRRTFALSFNKFSPSLGIPKLPPLPATSFPVTAGENGSGTVYQPVLPYKNEAGKKTTSVLSSPIAAITSSIDTEQLMKLIAIAMILFAAAAHVRLFLSRSVEE